MATAVLLAIAATGILIYYLDDLDDMSG
jgi:hypothetical protein